MNNNNNNNNNNNIDLNLFTSSIDVMSIGKSFQSIGAMTEKALNPYVFKLQRLITRRHLSEDDRRYLAVS